MLANLSACITDCYRHAEACERKAALETNSAIRLHFLDMAERWLKLARSYQAAERIARSPSQPADKRPHDQFEQKSLPGNGN